MWSELWIRDDPACRSSGLRTSRNIKYCWTLLITSKATVCESSLSVIKFPKIIYYIIQCLIYNTSVNNFHLWRWTLFTWFYTEVRTFSSCLGGDSEQVLYNWILLITSKATVCESSLSIIKLPKIIYYIIQRGFIFPYPFFTFDNIKSVYKNTLL